MVIDSALSDMDLSWANRDVESRPTNNSKFSFFIGLCDLLLNYALLYQSYTLVIP